jgi:electron transfer flavoprotein beta subunit
MTIIVCVKQVPASTSVKIDPRTNRLVRDGVESIMNPYDLHALELALQLKTGADRIVALSMGPLSAAMTLREALAFGADDAILLSDRAFAGSDTYATSKILAAAVKRLDDVPLVLCGKMAIDGDTAQVGPGIAAHLGFPQAMNAVRVDRHEDGRLVVVRRFESGTDTAVLDPPAVLGVEKSAACPHVPGLREWLAAGERLITYWSAEDLRIDPSGIGLEGSPTRVVSSGPPPRRRDEPLRIAGSPADVARTIFLELRYRSLI